MRAKQDDITDGGATAGRDGPPFGFTGFVALVAALMALNPLAMDLMLPALTQIGDALGETTPNGAQAILVTYFAGFGAGQLFMGVLADRFGRKPVLIGGLAVYVAACAASALSTDMAMLVAARFVQGFGSAAPRVVATAIVRDCFEGRTMARVMSLSMMVFMAAPIFAPGLGQLLLLGAGWPWLFGALGLYGATLLAICAMRLPETLNPADRRAIRLGPIRAALGSIFGARATVGYSAAAGVFLGALIGFVVSAEQVLGEVLGLGVWFPLVFGGIGAAIAMSSYVNARLVERMGMRRLSHGAVIFFIAVSTVLSALALTGAHSALVIAPLLWLAFLAVGLVFSNFNALAMEPQGAVAGIAASLIGAATTLIAAGLGGAIGAAFDGTLRPLTFGFLIGGLIALAIVWVTERGRLFEPAGDRR